MFPRYCFLEHPLYKFIFFLAHTKEIFLYQIRTQFVRKKNVVKWMTPPCSSAREFCRLLTPQNEMLLHYFLASFFSPHFAYVFFFHSAACKTGAATKLLFRIFYSPISLSTSAPFRLFTSFLNFDWAPRVDSARKCVNLIKARILYSFDAPL